MALLEGYQAGTLVADLAKVFDVHQATVHEHVRRAGLTGRRDVPKLNEQDLAAAAKLYRDGWTLHELAEHYHLDDTTVRNLLCRAGVSIRRSGRPSRHDS